MIRKLPDLTREYEKKDECKHFWVIEIANGPNSQGVCKYCGLSKEFMNTMPVAIPIRRHGNPLKLPEIPGVELKADSKS